MHVNNRGGLIVGTVASALRIAAVRRLRFTCTVNIFEVHLNTRESGLACFVRLTRIPDQTKDDQFLS